MATVYHTLGTDPATEIRNRLNPPRERVTGVAAPVDAVPEPATCSLLKIGLLLLAVRPRRGKRL